MNKKNKPKNPIATMPFSKPFSIAGYKRKGRRKFVPAATSEEVAQATKSFLKAGGKITKIDANDISKISENSKNPACFTYGADNFLKGAQNYSFAMSQRLGNY